MDRIMNPNSLSNLQGNKPVHHDYEKHYAIPQDKVDKILFLLFDRDELNVLNQPFMEKALHLSSERLELLTSQWTQWRPYLDRWHPSSGESTELTP